MLAQIKVLMEQASSRPERFSGGAGKPSDAVEALQIIISGSPLRRLPHPPTGRKTHNKTLSEM